MKAKQTYLKGKSVFIVSLLVIGITILTVYLTGINYNRTVTSNLDISLSIIGSVLFIFMAYGLYAGIGLKDNFPKFRAFKTESFISESSAIPDFSLPDVDTGDEIGGFIISFILWIVMSILIFILLLLLEGLFWISVFIILTMLYWVFFRALKLVFSKSIKTKGDLGISLVYSLGYTFMYLGWIFGIVYLTELLR